jgi:Uma2 family endonuclease
MSSLAHPYLTEEQYLEIERKAEYKSEYIDGRMYAMAGGRPAHSELAIQLGIVIAPRVRPRGCRVFNSDMRIRTPKRIQAYPDLSVFCSQLETGAGGDSLLNPIFIGEVLSPSTESFDRGRKFHHYRTIPSLRDYLLVASETVAVELYSRQPDGFWRLTEAEGMDGSIEVPSIGVTLLLRELYEGIDLTVAP